MRDNGERRHPTRYRAAVAIGLGLIGFGVNLLDIELIELPEFKMSILAGLLFPLLVAQAWGLRYGLLSALAGGCQTMWWLWQSDGYGLLYSVPIFTLWIAWHGYWSDRRHDTDRAPWFLSPFVVEIPFRIVSELGFSTIFGWLVAQNPPPWNPTITWRHVPLSWVNVVAIKHTITAYLIILSAHVLLSLTPIRRFFRLDEIPAQRSISAVYALGLLIGASLWGLNGLIDYALFNPEGRTFWEATFFDIDAHGLVIRYTGILVSMLVVIPIARLMSARSRAEAALRVTSRRLKGFLEHCPSAMGIVDSEGVCQIANPATLRAVGAEEHQVVGRQFTALLPPDAADSFASSLKRAREGHRPVSADDRMMVNGEERVFETILFPIGEQDQRPGSYGVIATDVTERERARGELQIRAWALQAIRNINRLIVTEMDPQALLQGTCDTLVETGRYAAAWGASFGTGGKITGVGAAGIGESVEALQEQLVQDDWPSCSRQALSTPKPRVVTTEAPCSNCPVAKTHQPQGGLTVRLEHNGRFYGLLSVCRLGDADTTVAERALFHEVGRDIAFALRSIGKDAERARAREELRESQALLRQVIDTSPDCIFVKNWDREYVLVNEAIAALYGTTKEAMLGRTDRELAGLDRLAPEEAESFLADDRAVMRSGEQRIVPEEPFTLSDGTTRWFRTFKVPLGSSTSPDRLLGIAVDITDYRRTEEALRQGEAKFRSLVEEATDGIALADSHGKVLEWNRALERITGVPAGDALGRTAWRLISPMVNGTAPSDNAEDLESVIREVIQAEPGTWCGQVLEHDIQRMDGTLLTVQLSLFPIETAEDRILCSIVRDITERRRLRERLNRQQKLAAIGQLAGGIAHDFKNILGAIILYAQLPLDAPSLSAETRRALETIVAQSHRAADLVNQVRDFSRSDTIETRVLDLVALVQEAGALLRRTIPEDVHLSSNLPSAPLTLRADGTRLHQVLMNLVINAKDAMPDGGDLTITLDRIVVEHGETPSVAGIEAGDWARLTITDTGVGMTAEVQERMFEPFFTTKDEEGTGLGLPQVYGIVTQHGGHIDVESTPGRGSRFTILLPLVDEEVEEQETEPRRSPLIEPGGETILVVEDAAHLLRAVRKGLESVGYDVLTAANGLEALDLLAEDGLALVLTDIVMPQMGGEALLRAIRAKSRDLHVIAMTGHTMKVSESSLRKAGFDDVIAKPFSIQDLIHFVQQTLGT